MDNTFFLLNDIDKSELSEDDLAVLQAFEAMENKSPALLKADTSQSCDPVFAASVAHLTCSIDDDMLTVFAAEVEEDIASMQQMLENLKQGDHVNSAHLLRIKRLGHKLRGTAGAVDFPVMSTIASHVEVIAEQVSEEKIYPLAGLYILAQAITVLERYLCEIRSHGKEPENTVLLEALDATYKNLNIDLHLISEKQDACTDLVPNPEMHVDMLASYQDVGDIQVQAAHARLAMVQQEYLSRFAAIRSTTLEMRRVPLNLLILHLQHIITMSALAQTQQVQFEVTGESTEIDQDILAALAFPLIQLMHTWITETVVCTDSTEQRQKKLSRIWLHIQETGSEIIMEIGFSITIQAGAIEAIEGAIQRLNGKISLQHNGDGGLSIFLHIPHVQGAVRCLLVRVSLQNLVIPFSQIQRIVDRQRGIFDRIYHLRDLLGFLSPVAAISVEHTQLVLVMQEAECGQIGIAVDEVVGEIDLFVKPLKSYLQRPGIIGTAIDGKGSVTLVVDLLSLVRNYTHSVPLSSRWRVKQNAERAFSGSQKT